MKNKKTENWFATWFDSKYYHLLYNNRNDEEAATFLKNIISHLSIKNNSTILDLACGKGRHSRFLANNKFNITGVDLSENSIKYAKQFEKDNLKFAVKDMRNFEFEKPFDFVFNLFTSFGYFDDLSDNLKTLKSVHNNLNTNGILLIDFFNAIKVQNDLIHKEKIKREDIYFNITREILNGKVIKNIDFTAENHNYNFQEKVQLIGKNGFKKMLVATGFKILNIFGDYDLNNFDELKSDRLILLAEKV